MDTIDSMRVVDGQDINVPRKKQRLKKLFLIGIFLIFILAVVFSAIGYQAYNTRYHNDLSLAQAGTRHLQNAEALLTKLTQNPLDLHIISQARQEFVAAGNALVPLKSDVNTASELATYVPIPDTRIHAAQHLLPLAFALAQAGIKGCDTLHLLVTSLQDPLQSQGHGITSTDFSLIISNFHQMKSQLLTALNVINQLQLADMQFDPRISKLVATFRRDGPMLQRWLDTIEKVLPILPTLLGIGSPANYLIEVLDATELRPGGGFIGNYGFATLMGGRLVASHITDVDLLDRPFEAAGHTITLPPTDSWFDLAPNSWSFRDSNLDADFPTDALTGELNYKREGGTIPLQGVFAFTPVLIQHILTVTGPISVPEYHETINAQNLIERIHFHQLGRAGEGSDRIASPDGHSSLRKRFTELLAEHLFARVRLLAASNSSRFIQLMMMGLRSKDLQIYFNAPTAETLLRNASLDASIQSPLGDDLLVVDANISANKANSFISNTLFDQITIDTQGNAVHHTMLRYSWTTPGPIYGNALYRDYVRIYTPIGSKLQTQSGWQPRGLSKAFHHNVWAGFFTLIYGQTATISFTWSTPHSATSMQSDWHYQDTIQRQAGIRWLLHIQIQLPACAVINNVIGKNGLKIKQHVTFTQTLAENTAMGVDYSC